jgi:transcriptional regulator NrdR family protein
MKCPECGGKFGVIDYSVNDKNLEIYRKKACHSCGYTIFTVEYETELDDNYKRNWTKYYRGKLSNRKKEGDTNE